MPRHCPECGSSISKRGACTECSYGRSATSTDDESWRCIHGKDSDRCPNAGTIKANGPGGFYCATHRPNLPLMADGVPVPPPMGFAALRAKVRLRPIDFEAEAERIALQNEP